ncbi:MAG: hypothetical protein GY925_08000 [Actinomycetia bacterium]|nr:hypothetical protein [Actinomycetes bacterium]
MSPLNRVARTCCLLFLAGLLIASIGCSPTRSGGDDARVDAPTEKNTTSLVSEPSSDTARVTTTTNPSVVFPPSLGAVFGDGPPPPPLTHVGLADGLLLITEINSPGRALLNDELQVISFDPTAPAEESANIVSWPERVWAPFGTSIRVLDLRNNEGVEFSGIRPGRPLDRGLSRFLAVAGAEGPDDETFLIDLEQMEMIGTGGLVRYQGPALSPDQQWLSIDGAHSTFGPQELRLTSPLRPLLATVVYRSPENTSFVNAGAFAFDGHLEVMLRTTDPGPLRLARYRGLPGEPLQLETDQDRWERLAHGSSVTITDEGPSITTDDGLATALHEQHLLCRSGPDLAIFLGDRVRVIRGDELSLDHPIDQGSSGLDAEWVRVGRYQLYASYAVDSSIVVLDCERSEILDLTEQIRAGLEGEWPPVVERVSVSLSGTAAVLTVRGDFETALVRLTEDDIKVGFVEGNVRGTSLSPTGSRLALTIRTQTSARYQILDTITLEEEVDIDLQLDADPIRLVWTA